MTYDSREDTLKHINEVQKLLLHIGSELTLRAMEHDKSKLRTPEKEVFDEFTPKLKDCTYGSVKYAGFLKAMKPALDHHYANNRHHPEHFPAEGIGGMNLIDLVEMFCDWLAATRRHDDGNIHKSIEQNRERFGYGELLAAIFHNTASDLEDE